MNMLENLNKALDYIEQNLENEIDENELARFAHCSVYHFKRMFSYLADISLHEYIRRRRLSLAALELQNSSVKVIDVAMKYGYHSPDAFTRAFQAHHEVTPTELRMSSQSLKLYSPMTFRLSIRGGEPMKFRIENKEAFQVIGISNRVTPIEMGEHPGVEQVWRSTNHDTYAELKSLNNVEPIGILHVNVGEAVGPRKTDFDYYLSVASTESCPDKFTRLSVPAMTWAVIDIKVPWEPEKWKQIYGEWFPSSGYEQVEGPVIQLGPEIQIGVEKQSYTEEVEVQLWIPVKKVR
ncbi:AraC family transcriptional regulator [Paenibacillus nasutitermitis]|uniref:AraC family transcriptional regulator n=1 Tax=Paenibacillus nasutitermitis TaxID=1652958 RepID=A0A916YUG1_9BACL|nr:AraC family transcriptional regulator [Paenibacillus nasutitermitis]GGD61819.1 AraC family transcriptional regulator [Paenibacillus nasutitermitis]